MFVAAQEILHAAPQRAGALAVNDAEGFLPGQQRIVDEPFDQFRGFFHRHAAHVEFGSDVGRGRDDAVAARARIAVLLRVGRASFGLAASGGNIIRLRVQFDHACLHVYRAVRFCGRQYGRVAVQADQPHAVAGFKRLYIQGAAVDRFRSGSVRGDVRFQLRGGLLEFPFGGLGGFYGVAAPQQRGAADIREHLFGGDAGFVVRFPGPDRRAVF